MSVCLARCACACFIINLIELDIPGHSVAGVAQAHVGAINENTKYTGTLHGSGALDSLIQKSPTNVENSCILRRGL